ARTTEAENFFKQRDQESTRIIKELQEQLAATTTEWETSSKEFKKYKDRAEAVCVAKRWKYHKPQFRLKIKTIGSSHMTRNDLKVQVTFRNQKFGPFMVIDSLFENIFLFRSQTPIAPTYGVCRKLLSRYGPSFLRRKKSSNPSNV